VSELLIGKSDADFYPPYFANKALEDEQEIMRTGKPILAESSDSRRKMAKSSGFPRPNTRYMTTTGSLRGPGARPETSQP
jgi:hypothetical protein